MSDLTRLMAQIDAEMEAAQQALTGVAIVAPHWVITQKMEQIYHKYVSNIKEVKIMVEEKQQRQVKPTFQQIVAANHITPEQVVRHLHQRYFGWVTLEPVRTMFNAEPVERKLVDLVLSAISWLSHRDYTTYTTLNVGGIFFASEGDIPDNHNAREYPECVKPEE